MFNYPEHEIMKTLDNVSCPPRLDTGEPPPLLILFHGYGANKDDLIGLADLMDPRLHVISPQAPIDLTQYGMPGGRAWFNLHQDASGEIQYDAEGARSAVHIAATFVNEAIETISCDPKRVMVMGFSQGAMLAHSLLLMNMVPLAGIAGCSGRLVEELFESHPGSKAAGACGDSIAAGLPVLLTHGTLDDLIPVSNGHALRDLYQRTPAAVTYVEEPIGHGIGPEATEALAAWSRQTAGATA
jgi:phospholipase/carboxylesterase